jgi:hypothetical protein
MIGTARKVVRNEYLSDWLTTSGHHDIFPTTSGHRSRTWIGFLVCTGRSQHDTRCGKNFEPFTSFAVGGKGVKDQGVRVLETRKPIR